MYISSSSLRIESFLRVRGFDGTTTVLVRVGTLLNLLYELLEALNEFLFPAVPQRELSCNQ